MLATDILEILPSECHLLWCDELKGELVSGSFDRATFLPQVETVMLLDLAITYSELYPNNIQYNILADIIRSFLEQGDDFVGVYVVGTSKYIYDVIWFHQTRNVIGIWKRPIPIVINQPL